MTRAQLKSQINKAICGVSKGIFSDESWEGVSPIWEALNGICKGVTEWTMESTKYDHDENNNPCRKSWHFQVKAPCFKNPIYGTVVASGAGTMKDPLSKYDVCAYVC